MGVAKGSLRPWLPYAIFILCRQAFCQRKKVILWLSEHGEVIKMQTECLATYLSFWLLLEQCLATSG